MRRYSRISLGLSLAACTFVLLAASTPPSATASRVREGADPNGVIVHEWGTFTSVAGADGSAVEWIPQQGPSDLPCFVDRARHDAKGWLRARVRMETPVLYFY